MATPISASDQTATTVKPQRVLACVLCQQRKIRCDRTFPCANCVRANVQCEQAIRQRRRRFPERELLARLRLYESLLRQHNIKFDPLHTPTADHRSPSDDGPDELPEEAESEGTLADTNPRPSREKTAVKTKSLNLWHAMSQKPVDPADDDGNDGEDDENDTGFLHDNDDVRHAVIKKAWNHMFQGQNNDHLLFGSPVGHVDLSASHPSQVHIFRLWQIYLDNINPLLKVTHTPTLQTRIIDAASDIANINPTLEALMFSIYCVSILSLTDEQCSTLFGTHKKDLLTGYQFACQQALRSCCILRSSDRECLTALYLYLVSIRPETDPASLSSLLSVAIRIAQRIGIHNESMYGKCSALEAEMRRRLWWSLIIFDNRICEMSDYKTASLAPTWDCKVPLNVNDFELQPEIRSPPATNNRPTEMLFAVVRSELADFVRHSAFHLNFTNPTLNTITPHPTTPDEAESLIALERVMEEKYLSFCNPENPLHFMTIWTMRGYLAKNRLLQHYSRFSTAAVSQTDAQRNVGISHALRMLECDTKLMTSPLTKGYLWLVHFHFPFPAYIHLLQDLKKRPVEDHADKAWEVMSNNYEVRMMDAKQDDRPFFIVFSRIVLQAWEAREKVARQLETPLVPPRIVADIRNKVMQMTTSFGQDPEAVLPGGSLGANMDDLSMPVQMDFTAPGIAYGAGGQGATGLEPWAYPDIAGSGSLDVDVNQFLLNTMEWNALHARGR
ncbi:C6 zinc finger domain protein [Aspergillus homomorphus CBS 101889]|uniref:C6 zinc finger domain protein n=1 Tax=Aspergillus homomorphus (strain CBS 101889) TaxID=1450537 RepID=A0A395HWP2_ASPHC|nr:C6 zinc finger domain protein [Aspergillus homomorphus CBS 101889]RAL10654.1 C6 zinc finger domain protein [Aspergillus homomorphus CBS 101889]